MPRPPLHARPPTDPAEERTLRKLASARHAPASLIQRARIITASWDGASVAEVAQRLGCHPKTVSKWLHRFNQTHGIDGIDGLADLPRPGLPRRISEHERGRIIQLAGSAPPGRLQQGGVGGALGIAVLGSIGSAIYHLHVSDAVPAGLPAAAAAAAARDTLGGAVAVAGAVATVFRGGPGRG